MQPREPVARRQLRIRADQRQQRRCRRPAHARPWRALRCRPTSTRYFDYQRPRKGNWAYEVEARSVQRRTRGQRARSATASNVEPTYFVSDAFNVYVGLYADRTPDWLVWQHDNLIGSFDGRELHFDAGLQLDHRQPTGAAREAAGHRAQGRACTRPTASTPAATPCRATTRSTTSDVRNLGFQIRYRYELAPLSYLYVVYGRGGFDQEPTDEGAGGPAARQLPPARRRAAAGQVQLSVRELGLESQVVDP